MDILPGVLLTLGAICWCVSWAMVVRLRAVPAVAAGTAVSLDELSIIIPARNEDENLARLLPSIVSCGGEGPEILVVDDQSTDDTANCARRHGATVLSGTALPDGWLGKPWACRQGVDAASGRWLLFLDADTWFEAGGLERLTALAVEERSVHAVCPYHEVPTVAEQLSAFFNVIMIIGTNAFTWRGARARGIGLFGQSMLVSRALYEEVGGHGAVKGEILENFHLARNFEEVGARLNCWLGRGTIRMRMFPGGLRELVAGWGKGIVSGAGATAKWSVIGVAFWISGLFMAVTGLAFVPLARQPLATAGLALYLASVLQVWHLSRQVGTYRFLTALFYPVGLVIYQGVFLAAVRRKRRGESTSWKGRDVH